jgi:lysine/ornithine N-monooxygenase
MLTVYYKTLKKAAQDDQGLIEGDLEIIDNEFNDYIDWLEKSLGKELGGDDQVDINYKAEPGPCCHTTNQNEREAWQGMASFWEWYN